MKAAVVIDKWKLAIFTRHLKKDKFSYVEKEIDRDTLALIVETPDQKTLQPTVVAAQVEAARAKRDAQRQ